MRTGNNFYIEIRQSANKTFVVRELDHPPIAMAQLKGKDIPVTTMIPPTRDPDAEYIDVSNSTTIEAGNETLPVAATSAENATPTNETNSDSETLEPGEEEEEILSPEDENVRREWGGNCTSKDWERCNKIRQIVVIDVIHTQFQRKSLELDCLIEPILCLRNGWTSNVSLVMS